MPNSHRRKPPLGEATHTQILNMYGPGAMVDLPDHAVLIGGLDFWNDRGSEHIHEPRLLQLVRQATGSARIDLKTPPKEVDPLKNISGSLKALRFPEWSVVQKKIPDRIACVGELARGSLQNQDGFGRRQRRQVVGIDRCLQCRNQQGCRQNAR